MQLFCPFLLVLHLAGMRRGEEPSSFQFTKPVKKQEFCMANDIVYCPLNPLFALVKESGNPDLPKQRKKS